MKLFTSDELVVGWIYQRYGDYLENGNHYLKFHGINKNRGGLLFIPLYEGKYYAHLNGKVLFSIHVNMWVCHSLFKFGR